MAHKYRMGQRGRRTHTAGPSADTRFGVDAICEVVRLMPADQTGQVSYRIRTGFAERAAREDEITAI